MRNMYSDQDSTADMDPETVQMLEAIAQSQMLQQQEMKRKAAMQQQQQYPVGTDMYYEMQEPQPNFDEFMRGYDPRFDPYGE